MPKLSINLVARNEERYLPFLLASLKHQTFKDWELVCVDNASTDKTVEIIKREMEGSDINYRIIYNENNIGFVGGHNQAFKVSDAPYMLLQNPDMYLLPNVLEEMVKFLDRYSRVAAIAPRLMRWNFERVMADSAKEGFTSQIDSIGIRLFRNRRALEWLTKQEWAKDSASDEVRRLYNKSVREVFGVSGALAMYRKNLLNQILLPDGNLFDPTYHSYKEDVDLAYRLQNVGHLSYVLLDVVAYHDRTSAGPKKLSGLNAIRNKARQSYFTRYHSYKNHLRTLYKNEYWQNFILDFPFIFWLEFKKLFYLLLTNPKIVSKGLSEIIKNFSYLRSARHAILKTRRMYWRGIRRWL
ncbi:MAG: glycosyltransferase family 2 protein [Patescibacteria group bacterium]|nr:glycosyltransferase family 2 protein [Patescibacteria group bacterium]